MAAAHLAARRAHRGADGRQRDPGRRAAEDGHVRPDPGRASGWRRRAPRWAAPVLGVLAVAAILVGCAGLPGPDRAEAADRVLQRRAHGLRAARHRHADRHRHPGGADRQHRARRDHRPAVLPGRRGQGPDRTPATLAELGGLRETAPRLAGLLGFAAIASLGLPGLAGFWGEAFAVVAAVRARAVRCGPLWRCWPRSAGRSPPRTSCGCCARSPTVRPRRPWRRLRAPGWPGPSWPPGRRWSLLALAVGLAAGAGARRRRPARWTR